MSIKCGFFSDGTCKSCDVDKSSCNDYTEVFTGNDYKVELLESIVSIYSDFSIRQIKQKKGSGSLRYAMAISGHCAQFKNDRDSIFYDAAVIVFIQQHRFKQCSDSEKYNAYRIMNRLHLRMDKAVAKDCKKVIRCVQQNKGLTSIAGSVKQGHIRK